MTQEIEINHKGLLAINPEGILKKEISLRKNHTGYLSVVTSQLDGKVTIFGVIKGRRKVDI